MAQRPFARTTSKARWASLAALLACIEAAAGRRRLTALRPAALRHPGCSTCLQHAMIALFKMKLTIALQCMPGIVGLVIDGCAKHGTVKAHRYGSYAGHINAAGPHAAKVTWNIPGPAANMTGCELAVGCTDGAVCWMTTVGVCCFFLTDQSILPRHTISPCCTANRQVVAVQRTSPSNAGKDIRQRDKNVT